MNDKRAVIFCLTVLLLAGTVVGYAAVPQSTVRTTGAGITTYVGHHGNFTESVNSGEYFLNTVNITETLSISQGATATVGKNSGLDYLSNYWYCDGTADDVQLLEAVAYVNTTFGGGSVYVEAGSYILTSRIPVHDKISIIGTGDSTRFNKNFNGTEVFLVTSVGSGGEGQILQNFMIDGNKDIGNTGTGIIITDTGRNVLVDNIRIIQCEEYGIEVYNSWGITIQNCAIEYCGTGIYKSGTGSGLYVNTCLSRFNDLHAIHLNGGDSHRIINCVLEKSQNQYGTGVRVDAGSYLVIDNNEFEDFPANGRCIFIAGSSLTSVGTVISNNGMSEDNVLIELTNANETIIQNNQLQGSGTGIDINVGAYRTIIKHNVFGSTTNLVDAGIDTVTPQIFIPANNPDGTIGYHYGIVMTDGLTVYTYTEIYIPLDSVEVLTVEAIIVSNGTGNMRRHVFSEFGKLRGSELFNTTSDSIGGSQVAVVVNVLDNILLNGALTGVEPGDLVGMAFLREGGSGLDTVDADVYFMGILVRYLH